MKKTFYIFVLLCHSSLLSAQYFTGTLTYWLEMSPDPFLESISEDYSDFKRIQVIVDSTRLTVITTNPDGKVKEIAYQEGDINSVVLPSGYFPYKKLPGNQAIDYTFVRKTNKYETLLDKKCRKYVYSWGRNKIEAWIPEGQEYPGSFANGEFFKRYFFDRGLAYKIVMSYKERINTFTLDDIQANGSTHDFKEVIELGKKD